MAVRMEHAMILGRPNFFIPVFHVFKIISSESQHLRNGVLDVVYMMAFDLD